MIRKVSLFLMLLSLIANCSKKKDDNSLRNLLILGFLSQSTAETVSLTPGVSVRQKVLVIEGQEMNYTISQATSTSSSTLTKSSLFDSRVVISLVDSDNKEVYSTITIPGSTEIIKYTPKKTGEFTVVITPVGKGTVTTSVQGGTISNSLGSENSSVSALSGKRKYRISGSILQGSWVLATVEEATGISADGKGTFTPITNAVVTLTVDGTTNFSTTYNANHSLGGVFAFPWSGYANDTVGNSYGGNLNGRKLRLKVSHPTIADISLDAEITAFPDTVTDVKMNGISSVNGSGETLTLDKTQPLTMTWKNATSNKPELTQFQVNSANNAIITLLVPAENETFTISKDLLSSGLTSSETNNSDNCVGAIGELGLPVFLIPPFM